MPESDPRFNRYVEVFSYRRWSSKAQSHGQSRTRQDDMAADWAKRHGIRLSSRKLVDAGASGFHGVNLQPGGALGRLLNDLKAGKIPTPSLLLVEAADRFGRRPPLETIQRVFGECLQYGLDLYLLDRDLLVDSEAVNSDVSVLIRLALEVDAAHRYSARLSLRMLQAHAEGRKAVAEGQIARPGWRPEWVDLVDAQGNVIPRTAPRELAKTGVRWQLNELASVVERIVAMAEQGIGQTSICKTLNKEGVPPLRSERTYASALAKAQEDARLRKVKFDPASVPVPKWNPGQVEHLLRSHAVAGGRELKRRTGDIAWDYYPAVITRARWEALKQLLNSKASGAGAGPQQQLRYIGQAVTTCANCGSPVGYRMTNHSRNGQLYPVAFLRCRGRVRGTCDAPMLRMERVVPHILARLTKEQLSHLFPAQQEDAGRAALTTRIAGLRQQHRETMAMVATAEAEISKALATEPALAAVLGRQVVAGEERAAELEQQLLATEHSLEQLDQSSSQTEAAELAEHAAKLFTAFLDKEDTAKQRRTVNTMLKRLAIRIVVDATGERIGMAAGPGSELRWEPLDDVLANIVVSSGGYGLRGRGFEVPDDGLEDPEALAAYMAEPD